jgi:hypothetical protein
MTSCIRLSRHCASTPAPVTARDDDTTCIPEQWPAYSSPLLAMTEPDLDSQAQAVVVAYGTGLVTPGG